MLFGFLAYPIRLVMFDDVKNNCTVKGVSLAFPNMLHLRKSQREACIGNINLGITDVEITEDLGMDKITEKQNMELIKERVFDSWVSPTNIERLSNIYLRRDDRSGRKSKR